LDLLLNIIVKYGDIRTIVHCPRTVISQSSLLDNQMVPKWLLGKKHIQHEYARQGADLYYSQDAWGWCGISPYYSVCKIYEILISQILCLQTTVGWG
jgi:hypothetical protein